MNTKQIPIAVEIPKQLNTASRIMLILGMLGVMMGILVIQLGDPPGRASAGSILITAAFLLFVNWSLLCAWLLNRGHPLARRVTMICCLGNIAFSVLEYILVLLLAPGMIGLPTIIGKACGLGLFGWALILMQHESVEAYFELRSAEALAAQDPALTRFKPDAMIIFLGLFALYSLGWVALQSIGAAGFR